MNNTTYYTMNMNNQVSPAWQPDGATNSKIIQDSNITSNWKYRQYIQQNAGQIMKYNSMEAISASGNNPYYTNQGQIQSTSLKFVNTFTIACCEMRVLSTSI